ncbi:glycosyl hydrolase-related protein [Parabacteroides sp. OttesenSCG-928-N08]|nr:glycosyl hydrolase-related protein [Parabacteroides sp. OttesenSCG-928-N08]
MKRKLSLFIFLSVCLSIELYSQIENGVYTCDEESFTLLKKMSDSQLKHGEIYLFTTTHQDLGWLDHIEACTINRDTMWLTPFLQRLEDDPTFKMDIEQTSILMEYIHRHPEKKETISNYLKEGRICVGATYIQPYEEMYSGESLARQFYFGNKWLKDNFDGYKALSYFNVDVPGRTLQMPQIMQKAGVDNLIISRHERGLFYWEAPDGSKVRTYTPGHYIYFYNVLGLSDSAAIKEIAKESVLWYTKYNDVPKMKTVMPAMLNYEFIWDQKPVENCAPLMAKWNSITHIKTGNGKKTKVTLPKFRYAMADEFFNRLDQSTSELPIIKGERPNVWLYIHGPSHERALTASREGDILLPAVEKMASFNAITNRNYIYYPVERIQKAWEAKIYPDHGWGGNGGLQTDNIFLSKYEYALSEASALMDENSRMLASQIKGDANKGRSLVVFNTLSWERDDPASVNVRFEKGYATNLSLVDSNGNVIPCQLSDMEHYTDQSIRSATLHFVARNVPPMGYQSYYITPLQAALNSPDLIDSNLIETPFYRVELSPGGVQQITDKELGVDLLYTDKFLGGEIITMKSEGNGAGEFDAVQQPTMEGFDQIANHQPSWKIAESGDVFTSLTYRSKIRHAVVEQTLRIYHQVKKIDFDVALLNWEGVLFREFRMMFPLNMSQANISYEVPYGIMRVGKDEMPGAAGERYYVENREQRPRGIGNWIAAADDRIGVTVSSSVAVADYIDPTSNPSHRPILQPILLASRKSCHWLGNDYLQHGDHYYQFSFTSHSPYSKKGIQFGKASNEKLKVVFAPKTYVDATLPASLSFIDLKEENVVITALKKCEDDESLILRLCNMSDTTVLLNPHFFRKPKEIIKVNLVEDEIEVVNQMVLGKYAIETFKLKY